MNEIGILGGTFDPFHLGHLSIAKTALEEFDLDEIILLPANVSPFKVGREMADEADRIAMLNLIAAENKQFTVSTVETDTDEVSYTYRTLGILQKQMPDDKLWFIMGTDSFVSLEEWYKGEELLREYAFIVAPRPGSGIADVEKTVNKYRKKYDASIRIVHNEMLDISSTEIKQAIDEGASIECFVPKSIERYIDEHGLYK